MNHTVTNQGFSNNAQNDHSTHKPKDVLMWELVFNLYGCDETMILNEERMKSLIVSALIYCMYNPLKKISYKNCNYGVSVTVIHNAGEISAHSHPEQNFVAIRMLNFTHTFNPDFFITYFQDHLFATRLSICELHHGKTFYKPLLNPKIKKQLNPTQKWHARGLCNDTQRLKPMRQINIDNKIKSD